MADITTSLMAQLTRAVSNTKNGIARNGLVSLKNILDHAGFIKSSYLKDYDVLAHVTNDGIVFEILLNLESTDIDPKLIEEASQKSIDSFENAVQKTYQIIARGGFNRVALMRDKRRPMSNALNRPRRTRDALHRWGPGTHNAFTTSDDRSMSHKMAMGAPRDMNINREGKLSISFTRQTRTDKSGNIHFPQGKFQGIVKQFMNELEKIMISQFEPELNKLIKSFI